jgi:hypothetical protein
VAVVGDAVGVAGRAFWHCIVSCHAAISPCAVLVISVISGAVADGLCTSSVVAARVGSASTTAIVVTLYSLRLEISSLSPDPLSSLNLLNALSSAECFLPCFCTVSLLILLLLQL